MLGFAAVGAFARPAQALDPYTISSGGGAIEVAFQPGDFDIGVAAIHQWLSHAANAVSIYFGRFPVPRTRIDVRPVPGRGGVLNGVTYPGIPPRTRIMVGERVTAATLDDDWTMTHELSHLAFPNVPEQHHWMEEGMATYVEPIARAQAGYVTPESVWSDMVRYVPKGLPDTAEGGLDQSQSWGYTYWGGALFCLLADVQYRERTQNRRGLQQAFRGILASGGSIQVDWPVTRAFEAADKAVGVPVLMELYGKMKDRAMPVDLPALWQRLGISMSGGSVTLRKDAELAAVREAITARVK
ncbi:MAG TPA: hypothetical protein VML19_26090 [Verrucomicrobiae bacterium]|nr:hypothetical protein [Verrucomicrobiae bacterium]